MLKTIDTIFQRDKPIGDAFGDLTGRSAKNKTTIKETHSIGEDIKTIRFYQEWFWDDKQNKLFIFMKSAAAMNAVRDAYGDWQYDNPLFVRKTTD